MRGFIWYELLNAEKYKQSSKMNYTVKKKNILQEKYWFVKGNINRK